MATEADRDIFSLPNVDPARYLFVRLFSRKNGWFRVAKLGYHDELVDVQAAVDEICNTVAPPAHPSRGTDIERTVPEAGPSGTSSEAAPLNTVTAKSVIKSNGISKKDPNAKANSQSKLLKGKMKATSVDVENVKDPLSKRPIKEVKQEIRDFGLTRFAVNEYILRERNDTDELLDMLSLDELKVSRHPLEYFALR